MKNLFSVSKKFWLATFDVPPAPLKHTHTQTHRYVSISGAGHQESVLLLFFRLFYWVVFYRSHPIHSRWLPFFRKENLIQGVTRSSLMTDPSWGTLVPPSCCFHSHRPEPGLRLWNWKAVKQRAREGLKSGRLALVKSGSKKEKKGLDSDALQKSAAGLQISCAFMSVETWLKTFGWRLLIWDTDGEKLAHIKKCSFFLWLFLYVILYSGWAH